MSEIGLAPTKGQNKPKAKVVVPDTGFGGSDSRLMISPRGQNHPVYDPRLKTNTEKPTPACNLYFLNGVYSEYYIKSTNLL